MTKKQIDELAKTFNSLAGTTTGCENVIGISYNETDGDVIIRFRHSLDVYFDRITPNGEYVAAENPSYSEEPRTLR